MSGVPYATGDDINNKNGVWCEFPFVERKHYAAGQHPAASESLGVDMTPDTEDKINPNYGHINRMRTVHDSASIAPQCGGGPHTFVHSNPVTPNSGAGDQWQTTSRAMGQTDTNEFGPKKYRPAKKPVQPQIERDGYGAASLFGVMRHGQHKVPGVGELDSVAGTWKASGHVPGYAGHLPRDSRQKAPFQDNSRSLDKSLWNKGGPPCSIPRSIPGYTGITK